MIPKTADEALDDSSESEFWKDAMNLELKTLYSYNVFNYTLDITDKPRNAKVYETKWIYEKTKDEENNTIYKAYVQMIDTRPINPETLHSPCVSDTALRVVLSEASKYDLGVKEVYIQNALHQTRVNKGIYIRNPCRANGGPNVCIKVSRCLRGMRNAHSRLYSRIYDALLCDYNSSQEDHGVFYDDQKHLYILLHVDRILLVGCSTEIETASSILKNEFEVTENYWPSKFLGRNLQYFNSGRIKVSMQDHINKIVHSYFSQIMDRFCFVEDERTTPVDCNYEHDLNNEDTISNEKLITAYKSFVSSLSYISSTGRPDITFAVSILFKHFNNPTINDLNAMACVIIYLNDTRDLGIHYGLPWQNPGFVGYVEEPDPNYVGLNIYVDSNYSNSATGASHMGLIVLLNSDIIHWGSRKIQQKAESYFETSLHALEYALEHYEKYFDLIEDTCDGFPNFNLHVHEIVYRWLQSSYYEPFRTDSLKSKYDRINEFLSYTGNITLHPFSNTNPVIDLMIQSNGSSYHSKLLNKLRFKRA